MVDHLRQSLIFAHQEWIGFVQPVGLVVAPTVMVDAQVVPDRNISGRQREFRDLLQEAESGVTARWSVRTYDNCSSTGWVGRRATLSSLISIEKS